jgi:hypothetical protein
MSELLPRVHIFHKKNKKPYDGAVRSMYKSMAMSNRYVLCARFGEERPVGPRRSIPSRVAENSDDLRPGQILSVRKACDRFFENRGLKQVPFGTFPLRKTGNKD